VQQRIVVTGAQGFLGKRLVSRLNEEGFSVLAVDRNPQQDKALPGVEYHVSDLSDPSTLLPGSWENTGNFVLIHLAWDMDRSNSAFAVQSAQVNMFAALLDAWAARGISSLIVPGSAQEFGVRCGALREGDDSVKPLTPYGWAKRSAHLLAVSWSKRTGIPLLWLRPFIAYGPGQKGNMLIPYAIAQAQDSAPAQFSDGQQIRDFVYIDDVIAAFILGVHKNLQGVNVVHLGGNPAKVRDVLQFIANYLHVEDLFQYEAALRRKGEPDVQVADTGHALRFLGWQSSVGVEEGIMRTCEAACE